MIMAAFHLLMKRIVLRGALMQPSHRDRIQERKKALRTFVWENVSTPTEFTVKKINSAYIVLGGVVLGYLLMLF